MPRNSRHTRRRALVTKRPVFTDTYAKGMESNTEKAPQNSSSINTVAIPSLLSSSD